MSLVHMGIMHNELIIERLRDTQEPLATGEIALLHDDAWRENRTRITQLEHERAIEYLGMYYTSIGTLLIENRLYQELDDYSSDTDAEEIFEALGTNLGPIAQYTCERQTGVVRVWNLGMLIVAGVWQPEPGVESTWDRRELPPAADNEPGDNS
jgi:hypothetical protein